MSMLQSTFHCIYPDLLRIDIRQYLTTSENHMTHLAVSKNLLSLRNWLYASCCMEGTSSKDAWLNSKPLGHPEVLQSFKQNLILYSFYKFGWTCISLQAKSLTNENDNGLSQFWSTCLFPKWISLFMFSYKVILKSTVLTNPAS